MNRILVTLYLLILGLAALPVVAASQIELIDGTVIHGDVVSLANGSYTIHSNTLGQIQIPESSIRSIQSGGSGGTGSNYSADIQAIQQRIISSPELMQMVNALMSDPQLQSAMNDQELMQLIMSGNIDALQNDPRIHRLMDNPSIRAIVDKMSHQ